MTKSNPDVPDDAGTLPADGEVSEGRPTAHPHQEDAFSDEGTADSVKAESQDQHQELEKLEKLLSKEQTELTHDEVELRDDLLEKHRDPIKQALERVEVAQFSGPLPPPGVLANYDQVIPGAAERIFRMAESEQENRHRKDQRYQDYLDNDLSSITTTQRLGQGAATLISLGGLWLAYYAFSVGASGAGVAIVLAEIAGLSGAFLWSRRRGSGNQVDDGNGS